MLIYKEEREAKYTVKFFQNKLKIDFKDEEIRYKKLYNVLDIRDRKHVKGYSYDSHKQWEENMIEHMEKLTNDDLIEFYFWTENQKNIMESGTQMLNTFVLAFAAAGFANILSDISKFSPGDNVIETVVHIIIFAIGFLLVLFLLCCFIRYTFYRIFHSNLQKKFYYEVNEIVKKIITKRKIKNVF